MNDFVKAAKILGSCFLVGAGMLGFAICNALPAHYSRDSGGVPLAFVVLGLWLLVGAWTGRTIPERVDGFIDWYHGKKPPYTPKAAPPATPPDSTPTNPA
jgi:hypothetical protein